MNTEEIKDKVNEVTHNVDDFVEGAAEKHNFPKWKVWVAIFVVGFLVATVIKLAI